MNTLTNSVQQNPFSMGGRNIGSNLEAVFMNPLSRALCELPNDVDRCIVQYIAQTEDTWPSCLKGRNKKGI